jgi:ABC-type branched-subunit amino acid transport system substrate-binding protein/rare lipoprotein A (peptidoglycan hydrolase)
MFDGNPISGEIYNFSRRTILKRPARNGTARFLRLESGVAVWNRVDGRTANGEIADRGALTAAHRTLPFGSRVRVINCINGTSLVVRVNDRVSKQRKFVINLSEASAKALGISGTAPVTLQLMESREVAANTSLPSPTQDGVPTGLYSERSAFAPKPTSPYGDLHSGTSQSELKDLSRSPLSANDAVAPPISSSSPPAAPSRVQTEPNKPADSAGSIVAGRSASAPAQPAANDERKDLSRSPPSSNAVTPPIASSLPPAASSRVQTPINEPTKPAADSAAGIVAGQAPGAPAQPAANDVTSPAPQGISDQEIRFGIVAPFSGSAKELGRQMKLGIETAFSLANETGGVNGRQLKLFSADDGYEPSRTGEAMKQLWEGDHVFGIVGNVGTPTAVVALPFALDHKMLFFGAFTGANLLRQVPPDHYVFNYRASYSEETEAAVRYLVRVRGLQPREIAVFAQQDSYGDAGFEGVAKAIRGLRGGYAEPILRLNYKRNTVDVTDAIAQLQSRKASIKAVVMVATYRAAANFIVKTRDRYPNMIYTNVSFVGSTALSDELVLQGEKFADGVIVTQVVPAVSGYSRAVLDYKAALAKYFPGERPDYVSFEGYVVAQILAEALKRVGPQLDTEKLIDTLETVHNLDMGLGTVLNFGPSEHQASHMVWGTQLDKRGRFNAIDLEADGGRASDKQQAANVELKRDALINRGASKRALRIQRP